MIRKTLTAVAAAIALTASVLVLASSPAAALETSDVGGTSFRVSWTNHPNVALIRVRVNEGTASNVVPGSDPCSSMDYADHLEANTYMRCQFPALRTTTATSFYDLSYGTTYYVAVWQFANNRWIKQDEGTVTTLAQSTGDEADFAEAAGLRITLARPTSRYLQHDSLMARVRGATANLNYRVVLKRESTSGPPESYRDYDYFETIRGSGEVDFSGILEPQTLYYACVYQIESRVRSQNCASLRTFERVAHTPGPNPEEILLLVRDADSCNGTSVYMFWTNLLTGPYPDVTRVRVQYKLATDSTWTMATADLNAEQRASRDEQLTISGLTTEVEYDFRVTMLDGIRAGDYNQVQFETNSTCGAPIVVTASRGSSCGEVDVSWSGGVEDPDSWSVYWYHTRRDGGGREDRSGDLDATATSHTLTGLGSGREVMVRVYQRSNDGDLLLSGNAGPVRAQTGSC